MGELAASNIVSTGNIDLTEQLKRKSDAPYLTEIAATQERDMMQCVKYSLLIVRFLPNIPAVTYPFLIPEGSCLVGQSCLSELFLITYNPAAVGDFAAQYGQARAWR